MIRAIIRIDFDSEWLIAGGRSTIGSADMAPIRDSDGFPYIPGRSLRGVLREAVATLDDCTETRHTNRIFGNRITANAGDQETAEMGSSHVGSAYLAKEFVDECGDADSRADLFMSIKRTKINSSTRTATPGSLREMEVCIPGLVLFADIELANEDDLRLLAFAAGLIRSIGHSKSRGLGRCRLAVVRDGKNVDQHNIPQMVGGRR